MMCMCYSITKVYVAFNVNFDLGPLQDYDKTYLKCR